MTDRAAATDAVDQSTLDDIRPRVAGDAGNRPLWLGLGAIGLLGLLLFVVLESRRESLDVPSTKARASDAVLAAETRTPSLYVPDNLSSGFDPNASPVVVRMVPRTGAAMSDVSTTRTGPSTSLAPSAVQPSQPAPLQAPFPADPAPVEVASESPIILDLSLGETADAAGSSATGGQAGAAGAAVATRTNAVRQGSRPLVVPQGTLISAVLETALDSTQPGQARALIGSNITSRRGERVLIPRGSRLFGAYQGELAAGQNRILVQWNRLVRPDGVTVAIDSPATDRLGRAGIKGRVNTHFFARLGGALLQSAIDVGTILASRSAYDSPVFIAVPGRLQGVASDLVGTPPKPSITVRPGTRISVFVVRDLDFSDVEGR